ncbi:MAG: hypothetical protein H0X36_06490 [Sphingomonadaceae bacterium]|nr:hypothetical protein [Sphingomonadaceae bacterium]
MHAPRLAAIASALLAAPLLFVSGSTPLVAADHLDPPSRTDPDVDKTPDFAADIADVYTFTNGNRFVVALTFAGPQAGQPASYDRDVLYKLNISNAGTRDVPEFTIRVRFGQNAKGVSGVQFEGVPGAAPVVSGPVENTITSNGVLMKAGLVEDPFRFDLLGFRATSSSGTLMFRNDRDFFLDKNDTMFVIDMPLSAVQNPGNVITVWGTTERFGGNI